METIYKVLRDDYSQKNNVMLKQSDLSKELGISTATISRLENGTYKKVPSAEIIEAYSRFFGISKEYILGTVEETKELKQMSALKSIGITEDVINTFKMIKNISGCNSDYSALVTEFFSHPEYIATIFQSMFNSLETRLFNEKEGYANREQMLNLYLGTISNYVSSVVYPNVTKHLEKHLREQEENYEAIQESLREDAFR